MQLEILLQPNSATMLFRLIGAAPVVVVVEQPKISSKVLKPALFLLVGLLIMSMVIPITGKIPQLITAYLWHIQVYIV